MQLTDAKDTPVKSESSENGTQPQATMTTPTCSNNVPNIINVLALNFATTVAAVCSANVNAADLTHLTNTLTNTVQASDSNSSNNNNNDEYFDGLTVVQLKQAIKWLKAFPRPPRNVPLRMLPYLDNLKLYAAIADADNESVAFNYVVSRKLIMHVHYFEVDYKVDINLAAIKVVESMIHTYGSQEWLLESLIGTLRLVFSAMVWMFDMNDLINLKAYVKYIPPIRFAETFNLATSYNQRNYEQRYMASIKLCEQLSQAPEHTKETQLMMVEVLNIFQKWYSSNYESCRLDSSNVGYYDLERLLDRIH